MKKVVREVHAYCCRVCENGADSVMQAAHRQLYIHRLVECLLLKRAALIFGCKSKRGYPFDFYEYD